MSDLTTDTLRLIDRLFAVEDRAEARDILARECGDNLPLIGPPGSAGGHERIRFASIGGTY